MRYLLTSPEMEQVPPFASIRDAVMAYTRVVTSGSPAQLSDLTVLPGLPGYKVAEYEGRPDRTPAPNPLGVVYDETEVDWTQALYYAKGFVACVGALSPFDPQSDPQSFADWYIAQSEYPNIGQAWGVWTEQRRKEIDR